MLVGRVTEVHGTRGKAEFTEKVGMGDFIYYQQNGKRVICQITDISADSLKGIHGIFRILDGSAALPKVWTNLYLLQEKIGGHLYIGQTERGEPVKLRVNPFFRHVLVTGITGMGKTHTQIVIHEEFLKLKIPSIVIDTPGECIHLGKFSTNAVIVEEMRFADLLSHLQQRRTVVFNLQGLSDLSKTHRCHEILSQLKEAKERDYKEAENDIRLLQIPPVVVDIDETEIYAPTRKTQTLNPDCRDTVIDMAKRGGKVGIGLMVNSQRAPALHYDVRSQCNSAIIFHSSDSGSRTVLSQLRYITRLDLERIRDLPLGQCIITGELVRHPTHVLVRDIKTQRARNLDFEGILGLQPVIPKIEPEIEETIEDLAVFKSGITFEQLQKQFTTREVKPHGECLVVPERYFKTGWKETLEAQGCKVIHMADMPGGSIYLVRRENKKNLQEIKTMAEKYLPRDTSKLPYKK